MPLPLGTGGMFDSHLSGRLSIWSGFIQGPIQYKDVTLPV